MNKRLIIFCLIIVSFAMAKGQKNVTGIVTDNTGEVLPGVTIVEQGTTNGTISDAKGVYFINVKDGNSVLVFSFIGFKSASITVGSNATVNVTMESEVASLDEVVVVGYGSQKRASVVGAISTVDADRLQSVATANLSNSIGGKVSGVFTKMGQGHPGDDEAEIFIRGLATTNSTEPLIMVDGIEGSLSRINPDDIESFSVLKDASATAVYGVRGANGVILITTKRGEVGKPKINVNSEVKFHEIIRYPEILDSYDYARLFNEAYKNGGNIENYYTEEDLQAFRDGSDPYGHPNIDWMDFLLNRFSLEHRHTISLRGGTNKTRYYVSAEYLDQNGFYKQWDDMRYNSNSGYDRFNMRTNLDFEITKSTRLGFNLSSRFENINDVRSGDNTGQDRIGLWDDIMLLTPLAYNPVNPDGSYGAGDGSVSTTTAYRDLKAGGYQNRSVNTVKGSMNFVQDMDAIIKGLSFRLLTGLETGSGFTSILNERAASFFYDADLDTYTKMENEVLPVYQRTGDFTNELLHFESGFYYDRTIGDRHHVTALALYNHDRKTIAHLAPTNHNGIAGRVTYGFRNKYLLEVNAGYNGSDQFQKGNRYAFLPAGSIGWVLSEEAFFSPLLPVVGFLKLRASYGTAGNDKIGNFKYLYESNYKSFAPSYTKGYYFGEVPVGVSALQEGDLGNDRVTWEIAKKFNSGLNARLFNNQLEFSFDYFQESRSDILARRSTVTDVFGKVTGLPAENIGKVENKGFEVELAYRKKLNDWSLSFNGNYSFARNKILFIDEIPRLFDYERRTGKPIGQPFGYTWSGEFYSYEDLGYVWDESIESANKYILPEGAVPLVPVPDDNPKPGDLKFVDRNNDGVVDTYDQGAIGKSPIPESIYGINLGVEFRNLSMNVFLQGAFDFSINTRSFTAEFNNGANVHEVHLGRWAYFPEEGIDTRETAKYPLLIVGRSPQTRKASSFDIKDGDYLRVKNIELAYSFPDNFIKSLGVSHARIYINANNLFTWDNVKVVDPEAHTSSQSTYPQSRYFGAGINLGF